MIELQHRYHASEQRIPLVVIDMFNDPDGDKAFMWLKVLIGNSEYLKVRGIVNKSLDTDHVYHYIIVNPSKNEYKLVETWDEVIADCYNFSMFDKKDKSTFPYWFAHWCSFQLCALNLGIWKFKYLFHDIEKPWLKLFWSYKKVQKWHRTHNKHHLEYGLIHGFDKIDWEALMIDWECSHMSKKQCPLNCREEMESKLSDEKWKPYENEIRKNLESLLNIYIL